jgi:geranylgeranyl pyrophosphate synthase
MSSQQMRLLLRHRLRPAVERSSLEVPMSSQQMRLLLPQMRENTPEQLASVLDAGGEGLRRQIERTEARLAEIAASHGEVLADYAGDTLSAGGKRLRPTLVFICAGEGDGSGDALIQAGAAVELLHMATLVHDDVLDSAALRRGRPTVFARGGAPAATATGDLLFSRAFAELTRTGSAEAVRVLSWASSALARGELMQRDDAWSDDVTPARYLERCELKTARLFEAACRLGAILGRPGEAAAESLGAFGSRIGVAFQIFDDVLDVSGPVARTGKPRGTDLLDGTVTLPLILARRRDASLRKLDVTSAAEAEEACDRIAATGALGEAREAALEHVAAAKDVLAGLELSERQVRTLELVADGVVERYA